MTPSFDRQAMARALQLARRGAFSTSPNPRVGCVIARDGEVLAEGWHQWGGEGHAEVNALAQLDSAAGCTAYVTLEPCSHYGRTPPCAEALIDAGVARVVVAMQDPNPQVAGRGLAMLREAGIDVECGLLEAEARDVNRGFIRRMEGGLPWLTMKSAMSLDGRTAMASGESQWITGPEARADVQRLRAQSCAIISGIETVLADNAALTVRPESFTSAQHEYMKDRWRQPLRVILDSQLRTPEDARLFESSGEILLFTTSGDDARRQALEARGAEVMVLPGEQPEPRAVMAALSQRGCNEVMLEAGATLSAAFWRQGLVDDWFVYTAPCLMGSAGRALLNWPMDTMTEQQALEIVDGRAVGPDWRWQLRAAKD